MRRTCANCKREFNTADRAGPTTHRGSEIQILYCSVRCKRQAGNRRYYKNHQEEVVKRNLENQRRAEQ